MVDFLFTSGLYSSQIEGKSQDIRSDLILMLFSRFSLTRQIIQIRSQSGFFKGRIVLYPLIAYTSWFVRFLVSVSVRKIISIFSEFNIFRSSCSLFIRPLLIFQVKHFKVVIYFLTAVKVGFASNCFACTIFIGFEIEIVID